MAAPLVGRRVTIDGLTSRPELNGTGGVAQSFDDAKGRYNVKLDSGTFMALKPVALKPADGGTGGGGGMPGMGGFGGMGGMPGMGGFGSMGGMPGGLGRGALPAMLAQLLARLQGGGISPAALGMGALALFFVLPSLGIGMAPALLLGGLGLFAYRSASDGRGVGGVVEAARRVVGQVSAGVSRATGRPVSDKQAALLLVGCLFLMYRYFFSPGSSGSSGGSFFGGGGDEESFEAYTKGYRDGQAGKKFAPVSDAPARAAERTSSRWGLSSLLSLGMAGSMLWQMGTGNGQQPFSLPNLLANARHANPMNLIMLVSILSNLFF